LLKVSLTDLLHLPGVVGTESWLVMKVLSRYILTFSGYFNLLV